MFRFISRKSLRVLLLVVVILSLGFLSSRALAETQATGWNFELVDENGQGRAALALDPSSRLHIAYYGIDDLGQRGLKYAFYDGAIWNIEMVDNNTSASYITIAADDLNRPHIAYYDSRNKELRYATYDIEWALSVIDDKGDVGRSPDIQVDSLNLPHVAYWDQTNEAVKYARFDGAKWNIETVADMSGCNGYLPTVSLALDPSNKPHISYDSCKSHNLKYAHKESGSWVLKTVDSNTNSGRFSDIVVDSKGGIHISYRATGLMYAYNDGTGWKISKADTGFLAGSFSSIGVDSNFRPHISYVNTTIDGAVELRHAYYNGFGWISELLLTRTNPGSFDNTSLAVSPDNKIFLAFWDGQPNSVRYATSKVKSTIVSVYLPFALSLHK